MAGFLRYLRKVAPASSTLPAWRTAMTALTWAEVGSNTLSDVDPASDPDANPNYPSNAPWKGITGHVAVMNSWSGAAWDDENLRLWIFGGGHADYAGNELYRWNASTALFERVTNPSVGITYDDSQEASAVYSDGQPRSFHTYNNLAVRGGVLWASGGSAFHSGAASSRPFYFDEDSGLWVKDADLSIGGYGSLCYDSSRDRFYGFGTQTSPPFVYDPVTHTRSNHTKGWSAGGDNHSIYDPVRDLILVTKDPNPGGSPPTSNLIQLVDAAGSVATITNLSTTGTSPPDATWGDMGIVYDDIQDRYLAWNGGTDVYVLTPGADPWTDDWGWSQLTLDASNVVTPTDPQTNGTFGRFWFSHKLNCVGIVNAVTEKMYVLALGDPP